MEKKILVIDDEKNMLGMLRHYLSRNGYHVVTAENGTQALEKVSVNPDLILLDINMPDIDGLEVCKRIRDFVSCPIIFLTARVSDSDKVIGLNAGGDDYIVKPFSIDELGARVDAHLRREDRRNGGQVKVRFDDNFVINYSAKEVLFNGQPIPFVKKDYEIIELLSMHPMQLMNKDQIFEHIWGYDSNSDSSVVVVHISSIRAKFAEIGCKQYIQTVWGIGYKWVK